MSVLGNWESTGWLFSGRTMQKRFGHCRQTAVLGQSGREVLAVDGIIGRHVSNKGARRLTKCGYNIGYIYRALLRPAVCVPCRGEESTLSCEDVHRR